MKTVFFYMSSIVNEVKIEMIDGTIKLNGNVITFRATKKIYDIVCESIENKGVWFEYVQKIQ